MWIKRARIAVQSLMTAYKNGSILYPRVDYDYISPKNGRPPSHPIIGNFSPYCKPMSFSSYALTKDTLPLFLANKGISTPASLMRILEFIETLYDDSLRPKYGKKKKIDRIIAALNEHMAKYTPEEISISSFLDAKLPEGIVSQRPFANNLILFEIPVEPMPASCLKVKREKRRDSSDNYTIKIDSIKADSIEIAMEIVKKYRIADEYLSRKNDNLYNDEQRKVKAIRRIM